LSSRVVVQAALEAALQTVALVAAGPVVSAPVQGFLLPQELIMQSPSAGVVLAALVAAIPYLARLHLLAAAKVASTTITMQARAALVAAARVGFHQHLMARLVTHRP
jgi:hypothetical protein